MKVSQQNTLVNEMIKPRWAPICRRVWIRLARDLNDRCCLKVYFTDVNKKGVLLIIMFPYHFREGIIQIIIYKYMFYSL